MTKTIICISLICVMVFGVYGVVMAQAGGTSGSIPTAGGTSASGGQLENPTGWDTFEQLFESIIEWLLSIIVLLSVVIIIYGGFQYIISAGDESKIKEAKATIKWAIIGFIIVIMSYAFLTAIKEILNIT
ncbi:Mbov_0395 family pilin-like conjugal transfer protein [Patescibacteria group bacterium]